jgi:3-oxoacyl-[acyl-carrier protein] reductase
MDIRDKRVVVTGGASGLGLAIVHTVLAKGGLVAVLDKDDAGLDRLRTEQPRVECFSCDVSMYSQVVGAMSAFHSKCGPAHVVINNAGMLHSSLLVRITSAGAERHDPAEWERVLATNLSSVFYVSACAVEKMIVTRTKGIIVNISSISAAGNAGQSAYSASKAGVDALTATWSKELGLSGIRVVGIAPGFVDTESTRKALSETALQEIVRKTPLKRLGNPDEIARAVIGVVENDFINGTIVQVHGGIVL